MSNTIKGGRRRFTEKEVDPAELAPHLLVSYRLLFTGWIIYFLFNDHVSSRGFAGSLVGVYLLIALLTYGIPPHQLKLHGPKFEHYFGMHIIFEIATYSVFASLYRDPRSDLFLFYAFPALAASILLSLRRNLILALFTIFSYLTCEGIRTLDTPLPLRRCIFILILWTTAAYLVNISKTITRRRAAFLRLFSEIAKQTTEDAIYTILLSESINLGYERMRIWLYSEGKQNAPLTGHACTPNHPCDARFCAGGIQLKNTDATGDECIRRNQVLRCRYAGNWLESYLRIGEWIDVDFTRDQKRTELGKSVKTQWLEMPLYRADTPLGKLSVDNAISGRETIASDIANFTQLSQMLAFAFGRLQAHAEVVRTKVQQERVLDHLPIAIFFKNTSGQFVFVNRTCEQYVGKSKEYIYGKTDLDLFPEDLAEVYNQGDRNVIHEPHIYRESETFQMPNGNRIKIQTVKVPLSSSENNIGGIDGVLGHFSPADTNSMVEAEHWERQFKMFRWFTHDSNEFLKMMRQTVFSAQRQLPDTKTSLYKDLEDLDLFVEVTICGYHAYGYWGAKRRYTWEPSPIGSSIQDVVKKVTRACRINHDKVAIVHHVIPPGLSVPIDYSKFLFMLMQLVTNAVKACEKKGPSGCEDVVIVIKKENNILVIVVTDKGCGCPLEDRHKVGESEFSTWNGSGLGLQIVRAFANLAGGSLEKIFPDSGGATFKIQINLFND